MPRVTLVRYTTKPERRAENDTLARAVFDELRDVAPSDVAYAVFRAGDDWVHLFVNLRDDDSASVTELPSFKTYASDINGRCVAPPEAMRVNPELIRSYGFGGASSRS